MQHHGPGDVHDGLNISFCEGTMTMHSSASKLDHLFKHCNLQGEILRGGSGTIVSEERMHDDPQVSGH